ncbi:Hypothetical protein ORPV_584 [Orpheovirus IHUMI-LCC2]|uniref:Uncharacterized protein n=1 Tax=Orpheovirus IHUMI-LCC2 TaxID=2023057 RepID=A0A2I2L4M4_9VIRU|nr:Hypothetical protein ORPV_584 [Orpheovirus IHUMI-LCC2]SNW62488.1 Hypothetical protein ORPV_584 [Orpheovirus IHUMI-LCC2]
METDWYMVVKGVNTKLQAEALHSRLCALGSNSYYWLFTPVDDMSDNFVLNEELYLYISMQKNWDDGKKKNKLDTLRERMLGHDELKNLNVKFKQSSFNELKDMGAIQL